MLVMRSAMTRRLNKSHERQPPQRGIYALLPEDQRADYLGIWQEFEGASNSGSAVRGMFGSPSTHAAQLQQPMRGTWVEHNVPPS